MLQMFQDIYKDNVQNLLSDELAKARTELTISTTLQSIGIWIAP